MRERITIVLFALLVAFQPLSMWTLLGAFGTEHCVRVAIVEGSVGFVLVHSDEGSLPHHHTAADALLASHDDHPPGAEDHVVRLIHGDSAPPERVVTASPCVSAFAWFATPPRATALITVSWRSPSPDPPARALPLLL
jgi:hypothetical protein